MFVYIVSVRRQAVVDRQEDSGLFLVLDSFGHVVLSRVVGLAATIVVSFFSLVGWKRARAFTGVQQFLVVTMQEDGRHRICPMRLV